MSQNVSRKLGISNYFIGRRANGRQMAPKRWRSLKCSLLRANDIAAPSMPHFPSSWANFAADIDCAAPLVSQCPDR
jgi:hypothetical protein